MPEFLDLYSGVMAALRGALSVRRRFLAGFEDVFRRYQVERGLPSSLPSEFSVLTVDSSSGEGFNS